MCLFTHKHLTKFCDKPLFLNENIHSLKRVSKNITCESFFILKLCMLVLPKISCMIVSPTPDSQTKYTSSHGVEESNKEAITATNIFITTIVT